MGFRIRRTGSTRPSVRNYGSHSLWKLKASCRSLASFVAVLSLCIYGAAAVKYRNVVGEFYVGVFQIVPPLVSLVVSISAIILLFLTRKNNNVHPAWLLSFDLVAALLLIVVGTMFTYWPFDSSNNGRLQEAYNDLRAVWVLAIILGTIHIFCFGVDIRDTHKRRKADKERRAMGKTDKASAFLNIERQTRDDDVELEDRNLFEASNVRFAEIAGSHAAEMPGRGKAELQEAHKVGQPAISTLELSAVHAGTSHSSQVSPIEFPAPESSADDWHKRKTSVRSFA